MDKKLFETIKTKCTTFEYTSLKYTAYTDVKDYEVLMNNAYFVLLYGYNKEQKLGEYHFGGNDVYDLIANIKNKNTVTSFIPTHWSEILKVNGFEFYAIWNDYIKSSLEDYDVSYQVLDINRAEEASDVTLSCRGVSRGFSGQSKEWMQGWIDGSSHSTTDTRDNNILYLEEDGKIIAVVCLVIYALDSKKGPCLWIREIAVHSEYQGKGYGRKLFKMAIQYGYDNGASRSFLGADETNLHAIKLYQSFGFTNDVNEKQIDMIKV